MSPTKSRVSQKISRNVVVLSVVSFFNDIATEMIYPVVPLFLTTVLGAPVAAVGVIEGIAEATTSFLRVLSGWVSDKTRERKLFVVLGYTLATAGKVVIGFAHGADLVFAGRFLDKVGKGTRTAPRDALIADNAERGSRGAAFGLHRAADSMGAVVGPLIAIALIAAIPNNLRIIFFIAAIPAIIGIVLLVFFVHDKKKIGTATPIAIVWDWRRADYRFKLFLAASIIFSLGNCSDAFLILRANNLGLTTIGAIFAYTLFNFFYAIIAYPAGKISDRIGARVILATSFILFSALFAAFGLASSHAVVWILFPLYGIYMGLSEGVGRAYIAELVPPELAATAFGIYQSAIGFCVLFASIAAGFMWEIFGARIPFLFGSITAALAAVIFIVGSFRATSRQSLAG